MLVQIFFFVFMLIAMAALYIDMGLVRLTQTQMQNAADTAALEGLRQRDAGGGDPGRRTAAANMNAAALSTLGEGPLINFTDQGLGGSLAAAQTYDAQTSGVYTPPLLWQNLDNDVNGDMVGGTYGTPTPAFQDPSCPPGSGMPITEDCQYNRADFNATDAAISATAPSFLVRLRRTSDFQGLDDQMNISSNGPTLPLLFGRGTTVQGRASENPNGYAPRVNGITVRATAIADSRPALRVGPPTGGVPGVIAQFALQTSYWRSLGDGGIDTLTPDAFGNLLSNIGPCAPVGVYLDQTQPPPLVVGTPVVAVGGGSVPSSAGYLPLYDTVANRVVGFGYVQLIPSSSSACPIVAEAPFSVTRISPYIAAQNATAVVTGGFVVDGVPLSPADLSAVLAANACLADPPPGAPNTDCRVPRAGVLMAPVVVR